MNAIFNLELLKNYQLVDVPGTYMVNVAYTITDKNLILDNYPRYLVSLRALTNKGLADILDVLKDDTEFVPFKDVAHVFMTGALWLKDIDVADLPIKGERVLASFDFKNDTLRCVHIELLPRRELKYINLNELLKFRKVLSALVSQNN